jgi:hypothetical protein
VRSAALDAWAKKVNGKRKVHTHTTHHTVMSFFFFNSFFFLFSVSLLACLLPIPEGFKSRRSALSVVPFFYSDLALHLHLYLHLLSSTLVTSIFSCHPTPALTATCVEYASSHISQLVYQYIQWPHLPRFSKPSSNLLHPTVHRPAWLLASLVSNIDSKTHITAFTTAHPRDESYIIHGRNHTL